MVAKAAQTMRKVAGANAVRPNRNGDGVRLYGATSGFSEWFPKAVAGSVRLEMPSSLPGVAGYVPTYNTDGTFAGWISAAGVTDHGALTGLSDDDHSIYALLAGRSGGQTLIGGTASGNNLTLQSTSHATKGKILFGTLSAYDQVNDRLGLGTTVPNYTLEIAKTVDADFVAKIRNTSTNSAADGLLIDTDQNAAGNIALEVRSGGVPQFTIMSGTISVPQSNVSIAATRGLQFDSNHKFTPWTGSALEIKSNNDPVTFVGANEWARFDTSGNFLQGLTAAGASAAKVFGQATGTAPAASPADAYQQFSADVSAGVAVPHFRTENGKVVRIYQVTGWALPTATLTRTTFDPATVTLPQLAERVAALITDLFSGHQLLGT
jgi:hypothetical protein